VLSSNTSSWVHALTIKSRAKLDADGAMAHLYHFCALLPHQPYVDNRPMFEIIEHPVKKSFTATVTLPNCVNASVRRAKGREEWKTRKAAVKDAAFQAYQRLSQEGLLNDHLLPLASEKALSTDTAKELPAMVEVSGQFDPWFEMAKAWSAPDFHRSDIIIQQDGINGGSDPAFSLLTPSGIPTIEPLTMHWDRNIAFTVKLGSQVKVVLRGPETLKTMRSVTSLIQRSVHSDRYQDDRMDFILLFMPRIETRHLAKWLESNQGRISARGYFRTEPSIPCRGFVRTPSLFGRPYIFQRWIVHETSYDLEIECMPLPRRRNFFHRATLPKDLLSRWESLGREAAISPPTERFPAEDATIDYLPFDQARFGLFIPGILQQVEVHLVAQRLCTTIFSTISFNDLGLVVTALSCPSAQWISNYQRLEFIGDAVLKFVVSRQLFIERSNWHEGYLSQARASLLSNNTLANAAIRVGLDAFIMAEPTRTGVNRFPCMSTIESGQTPQKRSLSSKVLADVVEALIGAAYLDGGFRLALICLNTFLPEVHVQPPAPNGKILTDGSSHNLTNHIVKAECVIGYEFQNKALLLESLTHPACERDSQTESYQRLEFLGDAVLDMVVAGLLAKQSISQGEMTRIKSAVVNGHLLGFFCLEFSIEEDVINVEQSLPGVFKTSIFQKQLHLWKFMRYHSQEVTLAQERSLVLYSQLQEDIRSSLATSPSYPWALLARLNPPKFFSDIVESITGAIFIDSWGDLAPCHRFLERLGFTQYLQRVVADCVVVEHPRNALQRITGSDAVLFTVDLEGESSIPSYRCTITVNGEILTHVKGCVSKDEALVIAAETAKKLLLETKEEHEQLTG